MQFTQGADGYGSQVAVQDICPVIVQRFTDGDAPSFSIAASVTDSSGRDVTMESTKSPMAVALMPSFPARLFPVSGRRPPPSHMATTPTTKNATDTGRLSRGNGPSSLAG